MRSFSKENEEECSQIVLIIKEMKKLVLFFAIATVVAFSACSSKTKEAAPCDEVVVEEVIVDEVPADDVPADEAPAAE